MGDTKIKRRRDTGGSTKVRICRHRRLKSASMKRGRTSKGGKKQIKRVQYEKKTFALFQNRGCPQRGRRNSKGKGFQ